ncbi:hypothetical protein [Streptomyces sp. NPDC057460]|uniref:hypothetical protein n=1 Tax=Streptomyces sp. NPDC057460 TaxID=3346141 RepID=UPI0036B45BDD
MDIAYGYEDNDAKTDTAAVRKRTNLVARYGNKFTFARLKGTYAKVLVFYDSWVITSFNWFSFRGDPERTYAWRKEASSVSGRSLTPSTPDTLN